MRTDTMWRDPHLPAWHAARGIAYPAEGMVLPMLEYDRGAPVGIVSYLSRSEPLPSGAPVSYRALAGLHKVDGTQLPFLTAQYDPFNWAFRLLGHNGAARRLLHMAGWKTCTEREFVSVLYAMRGHHLPALERYGVRLYDTPWYHDHLSPTDHTEDMLPWPCADISQRRRQYEPVNPDGTYTRFDLRNPCADFDLVVCDADRRVRLIVDYKGPGAEVNVGNSTHRAMSALYREGGHQVPYVVAQVCGDEPGLEVFGVNASGRRLVQSEPGRHAGTLPLVDVVTDPAADQWRRLEWSQWAEWLGMLSSYEVTGRLPG